MQGFEFALYGIPAVLIVTGIMELLKGAVAAAVIVGIVVSFCAKFADLWPAFAEWLWVAYAGAFTGLSACGVFALVKRRKSPE